MTIRIRSLLLLAAVLLPSGELLPAGPPKVQTPAGLAARIDHLLESRFRSDRIIPSPQADDAEFYRRACLDLTGRIPRPADVYAVLADRSADRRAKWIDRLLEDPRFAVHLANLWRADLLPEVTASPQAGLFKVGFERWLIARFRANVRYDRLVRELLAVPITSSKEGEPVLRDPERPNPLGFFAVKEARPENLASAVGRAFLGVRLECAQCHDHPFAAWTQEQFWQQAAFFAGIGSRGGLFSPLSEIANRRETMLPGKSKRMEARFLDGGRPKFAPGRSSRLDLADWITSSENPFFARATVNRVWAHLFGAGLVDPFDDFRDDNPPSDPELLDELARAFVAADFDLTFLIRGICLSKAYQRSSTRTHPSQDSTRLPARMTVRALTGEQFFDSLALATGYRDDQDRGTARRQFLTRFGLTGSPGEPETSVQQALTLLNGRLIAWATDPNRSPTLVAVTQTPGMTLPQRIEALYLATLSRRPTRDEMARLERYVRATAKHPEAERLADVFWMLLNNPEFRLNH